MKSPSTKLKIPIYSNYLRTLYNCQYVSALLLPRAIRRLDAGWVWQTELII